MRELEIQTDLVRAAKQDGGHAHKCSNRFLVGVVDLFVQLQGCRGVWIEVKFDQRFKRDGTVSLGLTPHQRRFIQSVNDATGDAGWLAVVGGVLPGYYVMCARRGVPANDAVAERDCTLTRQRGGSWPMREIVRNILYGEAEC